jgi:hypothetical protein
MNTGNFDAQVAAASTDTASPVPWHRRMINWWNVLRGQKQFFTPKNISGQPITDVQFSMADYAVVKVGYLLIKLANCAEKARKGIRSEYVNALQELRDQVQAELFADTRLEGPCPYPITGGEAMLGKLGLIGSECGEAGVDALDGNEKGFREEIADIQIRLNDIIGGTNLPIEEEVEQKMHKNAGRPVKHGKVSQI